MSKAVCLTAALNSFIVVLCSLSGIYGLLGSPFIATLQIVVYAGAVMVLFLFVIMLLDLKEEAARTFKTFGVVTGVLSVGALAAIAIRAIATSGIGAGLQPQAEGATKPLGKLLFTQYLLPFEVVSVLLLVAMVGVILLSKKDLK